MTTAPTTEHGAGRWLQKATIQVGIWCASRFGVEAFTNRRERAARVLEEAIELAQAEGVPIEKSRRIMEVVYSKPVGEPSQEAAGIMTTLMGWAAATDHDIEKVTRDEIDRIHALPLDYFARKKVEKRDLGVSEEESEQAPRKASVLEPV